MAAFSACSPAIGCDDVKDFICWICEEQVDADFYCQQCSNFYCGKCIQMHEKRFKTHSPYGRNNLNKWTVSKKLMEFLFNCEEHNENKIEMFCDDHSQLCCMKCTFLNHRLCSKVTPISKLTKMKTTYLQALSAQLETVLEEIKRLQSSQEASVQSLKREYKKHDGSKIQQMRQNINKTINACAKSHWSTCDEIEQTIKEKICMSIIYLLDDFDNSTVKDLKEMKDEVISIIGFITTSIHKCSDLQNELKQLYEAIQKIGDNKGLSLIASIKCELKIQHALTVLGKSGKVLTVKGQSEHNVRIPSDLDTCTITGCCVLPEGQILVADSTNKKVKLLNQQFQVVSHWDVVGYPGAICQITPSELAVTVDDNINRVQFIMVTNSQLVTGRKLQLQDTCIGIAHHQDDLFICSRTALYKYTLSGKLVCRLYEAKSGRCSGFAVSPTGEKLYITDRYQHKLITLARDGKVLATYKDRILESPSGLHVTTAGQLLVCGLHYNSIQQIDSEGRKTMATLTQRKNGVPLSVCYSSTTSSIIVGQRLHNKILVLSVK